MAYGVEKLSTAKPVKDYYNTESNNRKIQSAKVGTCQTYRLEN